MPTSTVGIHTAWNSERFILEGLKTKQGTVKVSVSAKAVLWKPFAEKKCSFLIFFLKKEKKKEKKERVCLFFSMDTKALHGALTTTLLTTLTGSFLGAATYLFIKARFGGGTTRVFSGQMPHGVPGQRRVGAREQFRADGTAGGMGVGEIRVRVAVSNIR